MEKECVNLKKGEIVMPTVVLEAVEEQINREDSIELIQKKRIDELKKILESKDRARIEKERVKVAKNLKGAGIIDRSGKISKHYL